MSYGTDNEQTSGSRSVFQRLGNYSSGSTVSTNVSEPIHIYSEPPPQPPHNSGGPMGIRIASRPTYMQQPTSYYSQSNLMYNSMSYSAPGAHQVSSAPVVLQERTYFSPTHTAPPMNAHEFTSSSSSLPLVISSEKKKSLHFVRDAGGIKDPTMSQKIYSFLPGNKPSTPYHYNPYSEDEIQWGNKGSSSNNNGSSLGSQVSSSTSSVSNEIAYQKKDSRLDIAKNIKITSYKKPDDGDDATEHHSIRKVTVSSSDSRSYASSSDKNSSRSHDREHSSEDRRNRTRQSSSGGDEEHSMLPRMREGDYYVPDYDKRPLPPRAQLTGRIRQRNRSSSPDQRHHSRGNTSSSPPRHSTRSSTSTKHTNINDRLNLSKTSTTSKTATDTPTTTAHPKSNHSRENSDGSTRYQNKTWVNPSEKLPSSKKFSPQEQAKSTSMPEKTVEHVQSYSPTTVDTSHKSYNKIWVKPSDNPSPQVASIKPSHGRDLRYKESIVSEPLPPSRKFSPNATLSKTATTATVSTAPTAVVPNKQVKTTGLNSVTAKPNEKQNATANKQQSMSSSKNAVQEKALNEKNTTTAAAGLAANAASASEATVVSDVKAPAKEPMRCSKTSLDIRIPKDESKLNEPCTIKVEESKGLNLLKDAMEIDSEVVCNNSKGATQVGEKRLSDSSDVPELVESKKRKTVQESLENSTMMDIDLTESLNGDQMELDSLQSNGDSTHSSSSNSNTVSSSETSGIEKSSTITIVETPILPTSDIIQETVHTKDKPSTTPVVPIATAVVVSHNSSNHLNAPFTSNGTPINSKNSTLNQSTVTTTVNPAVYEKEDILEQIFGDGYSRETTPDLTEISTMTSTSNNTIKVTALNKGTVDGNFDNSDTARIPEQHIVITNTNASSEADKSTQVASSLSATVNASTTLNDTATNATSTENMKTSISTNNVETKDKTSPIITDADVTKSDNDNLIQEKPDAAASQIMKDAISSKKTVSDAPLADKIILNSSIKSNDSTLPLNQPVRDPAESALNQKEKNNTTGNITNSKSEISPATTKTSPPPVISRKKTKSRVLPKPWLVRMSDTGEIYYFNSVTKETSDVRPVI